MLPQKKSQRTTTIKKDYIQEMKLTFYVIPDKITFSVVAVVHSVSYFRPSVITWTATHQASLSITNSWSLLKLMSTESVMSSNHLILCCPVLLLPPIFPSTSLSNESALHIRWLKYWSFSLSISPFNEYSGLVSFRIDWLDLLAA